MGLTERLRKELLPLGRPREQILERGVQLQGKSIENFHRRIVDAPLEPAHDVWVNPRVERKRLLAQVAPFTAFPNLLTKAPQKRLRAHAQGSISARDPVQTR
jgi:hypothetical protein